MEDGHQQESRTDYGFFFSTRIGSTLLSLLLLLTVCAVVLYNVPNSGFRRALVPYVLPYVNALGLDQNWRVFSPDPARRTILVEARLRFADGSVDTVHVFQGEPFIGEFRGYHWRKWQRRVRLDRNERLWPPTARVLGAGGFDDPRGLEAIVLVRKWSDAPDLGTDDERVWSEYEFYEMTVGAPEPDETSASDE